MNGYWFVTCIKHSKQCAMVGMPLQIKVKQ